MSGDGPPRDAAPEVGDGRDPTAIDRAVAVLRRGGLVAFPTETVYGLGADATDPDAIDRIFVAKGRPSDHPLIVHIAEGAAIDRWARDVPAVARILADAFWPGPLTMILRRSPLVPDAVTGGRDTVGLRVPDHPVARALLDAFAGGLAAPSANRFGQVSPTSASDVIADLGADVDFVLDGGPCRVGVESTILDLSGDEPEILRPGGVSRERLADVLGAAPGSWSGSGPARAPGMLASHYSPRATVEVVTEDEVVARSGLLAGEGRTVAVMGPRAIAGLADEVIELEPVGLGDDYARHLYARLRQADRLGADVLLAVAPPAEGVGVAVIDRLRRAARS